MDTNRWAKVIALNVWTCRRASDMTQAQLAEKMDCTVPSVSRLESGRHLPSLSTVIKAAEALGVPLVRLFSETEVVSTPSRKRKK